MKKFVLIMIASAFFGAQIFAFNIGFFQLSFYRIFIIAAPLLIIINLRANKSITKLNASENYFSYLFMLFWVAYAAITVFFAKDFDGWFRAFTFIASGVVSIWCIGLYLNEKKDFYWAFIIVLLFVVAYSLHGYYEIFTGDYRFFELGTRNQLFYSSRIGYTGLRVPISVFGNPNNYALFCIMGFYMSLICNKIKINKLSKVISFLIMLSSVVLLVATQSRANFIGFCMSLLLFAILIFKSTTNFRKFEMMFIAAVAIITSGFWFTKTYQNIILKLITVDISGQSEGSGLVRINLIKNGIIFLKQTLFMGVGVGNIEYYMAKYPIYYVGKVTNMHNWWIEILVSSGIFVFIGYITMYIKNIILLRKIIKKSGDKDNIFIANAFLCFMIAFIVASMGSSSLIYSEWLWVLWGIIFAFVNYAVKDLNKNTLIFETNHSEKIRI